MVWVSDPNRCQVASGTVKCPRRMRSRFSHIPICVIKFVTSSSTLLVTAPPCFFTYITLPDIDASTLSSHTTYYSVHSVAWSRLIHERNVDFHQAMCHAENY